MDNIYLGRQSILNLEGSVCAYEIRYKDANKQSNISSERHASASVINSILNKFGTRAILGSHRAFVKIDEKFLLSDLIFSVPSEFFIFSILEGVNMSERVVERLEQLHAKKYIIAVDDITLTQELYEKYKIVFKQLSFIKIKLNSSLNDGIKELVAEIKKQGIKLVATRIDTDSEFQEAKSLGCDWFEGYYFAEPKILENTKYDPAQMNVLKLYNLLMDDTSIDEITAEFEKNHAITVQLLQFINSGAFHFRNRISSIHHILTLVGRIPLGQWLMLMIYSKSLSKDGAMPALMLMVKNRTELMQRILKIIYPDVKSNTLGEAYFVGVLSLIDTLFGVKLETILKEMNVSEAVEAALLRDEGVLGEVFSLVKEIELFHTDSIAAFEKKYELEKDSIENIAIEAMKSLQSFEHPEPKE